MQAWKRLIAKSRALLIESSRLDQSTIDGYRAALLLKCHEWHNQSQIRGTDLQPDQDDVRGFYETVQNMNYEKMQEYAQTRINSQITVMFTQIKDSGVSDEMKRVDINPGQESIVDKLRTSKDKKIEEKNLDLELSENLCEVVGFYLDVRESNCPENAGQGVFLRCPEGLTIKPGTVLGLFPGLVHLPEFTTKSGYITENLLPDPNFMLMVRSDHTIIDARISCEGDANPYAVAHMANHVPRGGTPNVFQYPYDFPADPLGIEEFPKKLRRYIPNKYAKKPTFFGTVDRSSFMRGMILLATCPLQNGDELLMDYRLNPKGGGELPTWYSPFDDHAFVVDDDEET